MPETSSPQELIRLAMAAYQAEEYATALEGFQAAEQMFAESGDTLSAAETANNRSVVLLKAGRAQEALDAAQGTDQIFAQAGDTRRQAVALSNQAAALEDLHQWQPALELYTRASELFKAAGEKDMRAYVLQRISALQLRTGQHLESLVSMDTALDNKPKLTIKDRILKGLFGKVFRMISGKN